MRGKDFPTSPDQRATLLAARVFAFLLLDGAKGKENGSLANTARLMKVALKAAKSCIGRPPCCISAISINHRSQDRKSVV